MANYNDRSSKYFYDPAVQMRIADKIWWHGDAKRYLGWK